MHRFVWALAVVAAASGSPVLAAAPSGGSLVVVGSSALGGRGMNAALAVAGHCAYVGSRNDAAPQVVDIADPRHPRVIGSIPAHPGSTPRELRAVDSKHLVVVLYYRLAGTAPNALEVYHWDTDCAALHAVGRYDFGAAPHEFYLWQDPLNAVRVLLFVTMFGASPGIQVVDISNPDHPNLAGTWTVPVGYGHAPVHSISVSADARTAFVSLWTGGLVVADVSDFTAGRAGPVLRLLTPPGSVYTTPGNVHSAVQLPGQPRVLTTDERYPTPHGAGCPFGTAHVVDVSNPARPVALSTISVPENDPGVCAFAPKGTYTSHNVTLTAHLALITWYSAGVQVVGLDDPAQPDPLAELRPGGVNPIIRDLQLGITDSMSWSYPVIYRGLIYVVDINQGLLVLRYAGAHQEEVANSAFVEGNSNVSSAPTPATPTATASAPASPSPSPSSPAPAVRRAPLGARWPLAVLAVVIAAAAIAAPVLLTRRRPHRHL